MNDVAPLTELQLARVRKCGPDTLRSLIWLVGLHDERPRDWKEQAPLAWKLARLAIKEATGVTLDGPPGGFAADEKI